jgi:hypothetical protein
MINNELDKIWKEMIVTWNLPGGSEEIHERSQSGYSVSELRFEPGTFRIRNKSANHS